ncbi:MAG: ABC transporter ATP-binding protein [Thiolinea sp.]
MSEASLILREVDKFYTAEIHAVRAMSMTVQPGEIIALLGSSGCGKTSTLRMVAGFEEVSSGSIELGGREIHKLPPARRNVAMAFEGYSLYPPLTVRDNIAFALKSANLPADTIKQKVQAIADLLEINDILDRYPFSISGGQQQRASLARALVRQADLYLLDEPMGQLEPRLRAVLRGHIKHYLKQHNMTSILVTHDQTEANALADRIAVMEGGILQQFATPQQLKERPANIFVGTFIGEPPMNVMPVSVQQDGGQVRVQLPGGQALSYADSAIPQPVRERIVARESLVLGIRPYAVHLDQQGLETQVTANQWIGDQTHLAVSLGEQSLVAIAHERVAARRGDTAHFSIQAADLHFFDPDSGAAIAHGGELA